MIWGKLEKYNKVWRAGANENTTISFDKDVKIQGKNLSAGKYGFLSSLKKIVHGQLFSTRKIVTGDHLNTKRKKMLYELNYNLYL